MQIYSSRIHHGPPVEKDLIGGENFIGRKCFYQSRNFHQLTTFIGGEFSSVEKFLSVEKKLSVENFSSFGMQTKIALVTVKKKKTFHFLYLTYAHHICVKEQHTKDGKLIVLCNMAAMYIPSLQRPGAV